MSGFGNGFETEALAGALPVGRNSPQKCPYGLYAEQLSGSPFTAPRTTNERSWLYRIRPTVMHWGEFEKADIGLWRTAPCAEVDVPIAPMRWDPIAIPDETLSFIEGVRTMTTAGDAGTQAGMGAHVYLDHALDAGRVLLQRRRRDAVRAAAGRAAALDRVRHHRHRARRDRGHPARRQDPRRAHERAGPRLPVRELRRRVHAARARADRRQLPRQPARFPDAGRRLRGQGRARHACSSSGAAHCGSTALDHSPLDVVAWHGNYAPYKYDLRRYSPVGPICSIMPIRRSSRC